MQKIMFSDRYGLTQAVIEGRKTMTRRIIHNQPADTKTNTELDRVGYEELMIQMSRYKVGEIVAVAQSYRTILDELENPANYCCMEHWEQDAHKRADYAGEIYNPGYGNKMYVRADLMPHQIRITGVRCERLQDISDEECMKEGIYEHTIGGVNKKVYAYDAYLRKDRLATRWFDTPREAFAVLIDKVSGKGVWQKNPYVWVYEFELVK